MLSNLAAQQQPVKSIHELTMNDIQTFMAEQFDPKRFVVRERFKFWSDMKRKPGETIPELASRIRQDAATCDFQSIKDPLDEALRTKFFAYYDFCLPWFVRLHIMIFVYHGLFGCWHVFSKTTWLLNKRTTRKLPASS